MVTSQNDEFVHNRGRVPALVARIQQNDPKLGQVLLWNQNIGAEGCAMLADALRSNTVVKGVSLSYTGCGDSGAAALAAGLASNNSVQELSMINNAIGDEGVAAIAEMLKSQSSISTVDLSGNSIGEMGTRYIADAIRANNPALQSIDLADNKLNDTAARVLADAMQVNRHIKSLTLLRPTAVSINMARNTPFSPMSIDIINKCCMRNRGAPRSLAVYPGAMVGLRPEGWHPAHSRSAYPHPLVPERQDKTGCPVHHRLIHDREIADQDVDYGIYPRQVYDRRVAREHLAQPLALF